MTPGRSVDPKSARPPTLVALLVAGAFFMENLDGTVIATALPRMADTFRTTPSALAVGLTAYLVTLAVFIPASGWAADRFGTRTVFASAIALFTLASVLCGASGSATTFTLARVLQGSAGAMMTPVGRLAVLRGTPKTDLLRAVATLTWPGLVAPVVGPPLGGFITSVASWRWIFFINVPIGAVGLAGALWLLGDAGVRVRRPFDAIGFALNGTALGALLFALDILGRDGADWRPALGCLLASAAAGWAAVRHARRAVHPLVSFAAFTVPTFRIVMAGGTLSRAAISTMPFLLPLLFQLGLGLSPLAAGLYVLWYGFSNIGMKPATTPILRRFGFRRVLLANTAMGAAAIGACALIGPATPPWASALLLLCAGATRSLQFTALNTLAFAEVPPALTGAANTLFNVSFQLAVGLGIAFGAVALRIAEVVFPSGSTGPVAASRAVFVAAALVGLLPLLSFLALRRDAGAVTSGHQG